jgi:PAS domain S-box-containing protein
VWVHDRGRLVTRSADGKPEWVFGTHIDITVRKHQEEELRRQQDLLDRTGQLAHVGGWELDVASGQLRWSDEIRRMHGLAPGYQPDLATAINFYAPEARSQIAAAVELAMTQGTPWDLELPFLRADGTEVWAHSVGQVEFVDGRPVRVFGAVQDISERHALDQVLAHKTRELKRSNEELERFAYVTSHDLQEPLRMVTSYGQLLTRRHLADLKPEAQEFVAYMVDGGQRAQALIRDLLSLARLDSQARPWKSVALEATLTEVLRPLRLRVQETGAQVTHDPLPTVVGDPGQLAQLMANLLGNALKFCGKATPLVHVGAVREGSGWRISVRDNGIGIEPRYFDRIFQMFQRLHLRTEYDGTGIGLAICKKVVERHGGYIGVASKPGEGTTFFFTLPDHAQGVGASPAARQEP